MTSASPYTVEEEANTTVLTPVCLAHSNTWKVANTFSLK